MKDVRKGIRRLANYAEESEKSIERYLVSQVSKMGGICLKYTSYTRIGYPDRLILWPGGEVTWVELKSKGKKPDKIQRLMIEHLQGMGFEVHVADSREKVNEILTKRNEIQTL